MIDNLFKSPHIYLTFNYNKATLGSSPMLKLYMINVLLRIFITL